MKLINHKFPKNIKLLLSGQKKKTGTFPPSLTISWIILFSWKYEKQLKIYWVSILKR